MTKEEAIQKEVVRDRWSDGTAHHPTSLEALRFISELDDKAYGGYFDWRIGGDGDNGETLAYQLDAFFEFKDSQGMVPAARVEKLLEALESHAIPAMQRQMHSDDACNMPFNEDMVEALQIADQALAEYRGAEGEK